MEFRFRKRSGHGETEVIPALKVDDHPLLGISCEESGGQDKLRANKASVTSVQHNEFSDPLRDSSKAVFPSQTAHEVLLENPLGYFSASSDALKNVESRNQRQNCSFLDEAFDECRRDWMARKSELLQKFVSSGTISVSASLDILSTDAKDRSKSVTAMRMEELEDPLKGMKQESVLMSQKDLVKKLKDLNDDIAHSWLKNERINALKSAVKVAKLLSDCSVPQFYPALFALVSDILDTIGEFVYHRILDKSSADESGQITSPLPDGFSSDDIPEHAKKTCRNWFLKIGSIRELIPRLYLEMSILRCTRFLELRPPIKQFQRLAAMIRGICNPVVSAYARMYLARQGVACAPIQAFEPGEDSPFKNYKESLFHVGRKHPSSFPANPKGFLVTLMEDFLLVYQRVVLDDYKSLLASKVLEKGLYLELMSPAVHYLVYALFRHSSDRLELTEHILSSVSRESKRIPSFTVLSLRLASEASPNIFTSRLALPLSKMAVSSQECCVKKSEVLRVLAERMTENCPPPTDRLKILEVLWAETKALPEGTDFLRVANSLMDFFLDSADEERVRSFFSDILERVQRMQTLDGLGDPSSAVLESFLAKLVDRFEDLSSILEAPHFRKLLDFLTEEFRLSANKKLVSHAAKPNVRMSGAASTQFVNSLCEELNSSVSPLTPSTEVSLISRLVSGVIQKVSVEVDSHSRISFLVDCRSKFYNLNYILATLAHLANKWAIQALKQSKVPLSHSSLSVNSFLAFNEVTLPSISQIFPRTDLILETSQVALMSGNVGQAELLVKSAIINVEEFLLSSSNELKLNDVEENFVRFVKKLSSFLVFFPSNPKFGPMYLVNGLVHVLETFQWGNQLRSQVESFMAVAVLISNLASKESPYDDSSIITCKSDDGFDFLEEKDLKDLSNAALSVVQTAIHILSQVPRTEANAGMHGYVHETLLANFILTDSMDASIQGLK